MNDFLDIKIQDYEGPLDLLIHLVYKNEMNIFNVPISEITSRFIAEIKNMLDMNIEVAAEFINMASYLVYLKSRMLLPVSSADEEEIDPDEAKFRFNQLLIEYSFYKDIAAELKTKETAASRFLARAEQIVILKENSYTEDAYKLSAAFFSLQDGKKRTAMIIKNSKIATEEIADRVRAFVLSRDKTLWSEISAKCAEKIDACVSLCAVLELLKGKKIRAFQEDNFMEILLTLIKDINAEQYAS